ncbi:galactokinase [Maribacter sp. R77961]|uniref:galactokinase n=1 Tax=Maribacter sp. R77961 TaxID=3093871 RepID=UPI0037C5F390
MISRIEAYFIANYTNKPLLIKAPGRINIIGEHTDYNLGYVLPAAINKGIYFAIKGNRSSTIRVESFITSPEQIIFDIAANSTPFSSFWGNYFKAILEILVEKKYPLKGFDCVFGGDIPIGSGLSSSAALCCGFIFAISQALHIKISKEEIAIIAQKAEHRVGINCGLMDQYALLFGKKSHALFLDCKTLIHEYVPINIKGYSWVLINSNIKHNLAVDTAYNKRRASCEFIVKKMKAIKNNVSSLRDVSLADLKKIINEVSLVDYKIARYVLEENERVLKMKLALKNGNAEGIGEILLDGHWAMSKEFEITTKELDCLVDIGEELPGIIGSRMMGGGFGGCTINLIKKELLNKSIETIVSQYKLRTGIDAEVYHLQVADGIQVINLAQ